MAKPSVAFRAGGKWNNYDIIAKGSHLVLILNGTKTVDIQDPKFPSGFIALETDILGI